MFKKNTGMQLKDIKTFLNWCKEGESTFEKRLNMFYEREESVLNKIKELNHALKLIKFKQWYYEMAIKYESEEMVKNISLEEMPPEIRELYIAVH